MSGARTIILNIDDSPDLRCGKTRTLQRAGHEVLEADTAAAGLCMARELRPDLVLCAAKLPDMSSREICRKLKSDPVTSGIPLIEISATCITEQDQQENVRVGADICLTEPLEPRVLQTVVQVLLQLRRAELARAQAEHATHLKDEFLANLSHELRTPMNIIIGWAHLLRNGPLSDEQRSRATEAIERAARSQAQLIEDLLDVSRIVTGKFRLQLQGVKLAPVLRSAVDHLRLVASTRQITVTLSQEFPGARVRGDPDRLQQVFWNLLTNAVKFTPMQGCVDVRMYEHAGQVSVTVTDTGIGISRDFLPHVFDRFRQADSTSTRQHTGMGLGLAIVRHVVELHGGTVRADSGGENTGATFTVSLPLLVEDAQAEEPAPSPVAAATPAPPEAWRVLLVDDDQDGREMMVAGLEGAGLQLRAVSTAAEALALLDEWLPDVIVSDVGMPVMDGYEFMRAVRARPAQRGGHVPALALTGFARLEDAVQARASGFQEHLAKPVSSEDLVAAVARLRQHAPAELA